MTGLERPTLELPACGGWDGFVDRTAGRLLAGLSWFETMASPERCLARLRSGELSRPGSPAYEAMERLLIGMNVCGS